MSTSGTTRPPRWAEKLLSWLVKDAWGTQLGDFEEAYHEIEALESVRAARRWYAGQVLRMVPTRLYEKTFWGIVMLKSYLVIAYRSLLKNKIATSINIVGLSISIACALVAFQYGHARVFRDDFHAHADRIFLIEQVREEGNEVWRYGSSPLPLGPALEAENPSVVRAVRMTERRVQVTPEATANEAFGDFLSFVDPSFLDVFTFPLTAGTPEALGQKNTVILSATTATRYFGEEDAVGQVLTITWNGYTEAFIVGGVAAPLPSNTGLDFRMLVDVDKLQDVHPGALDSWASLGSTFVLVQEAGAASALPDFLARYLPAQQAVADEYTVEQYAVANLKDLTRQSEYVRQTPVGGVPWAPIVVLSIISVFLLTLSCLNFVNIALATTVRRIREIGVRKVMGGSKFQLVGQFLAENTLLSLLALAAGLLLAAFLLVPAFNEIAGATAAAVVWDWKLLGFLTALLVLIGIVSGAYPAFYISAFQPAEIFQGKQRFRGRRVFTQAFLTVQFVLAFITMIGSVTFVLNGRYHAQRDWGYSQENTVVVQLDAPAQYDVLRDALAQQPGVLSISGAREHVGSNTRYEEVTIKGEPTEVMTFAVGPTYFETLGLRLEEGRVLQATSGSQGETGIVVNEQFVAAQGWVDPLRQTVRLDAIDHAVVGVVADFHHFDFFTPIEPSLFRPAEPADYRYIAARVAPGTTVQTVAALEQAWADLAPGHAMDYFFQDAVFETFFTESKGITDIFVFASLMAVLIACMGLFGLAAQNLEARMKEIGVRKVLGASAGQVTRLVNQRMLVLLLVAGLLATPISYRLIDMLLASVYTYYEPLNAMPFALAYLLVLGTALLTMVAQVYKIVVVNPADVLRDE